MRKLLLTISLTLLLPLGGCDLFGSKKSESEPPVAAAEEPSDGAGAPPQPAAPPPPPPPPVAEPPAPAPDDSFVEEETNPGGAIDGAAPQTALPEFPWPPPRWSARKDLTDIARHHATTLGGIADNLVTALNNAGYPEYSLYASPGGFALVARLERTDEDGTPNADFRFLSPREEEPFDLTEYVSALFFTPEGWYRQIVFIVSDQPFVAAEEAPSVATAERMLGDGATALDAPLRDLPANDATRVFALVYEFRKGAGPEDVAIITPGRLDGDLHMMRSGIAAALAALAGD